VTVSCLLQVTRAQLVLTRAQLMLTPDCFDTEEIAKADAGTSMACCEK